MESKVNPDCGKQGRKVVFCYALVEAEAGSNYLQCPSWYVWPWVN